MVEKDVEKEQRLKSALAADIDTLYAAIGYILDKEQLDVAPKDRKSLIHSGQLWFSTKRENLKRLVCSNETIQKVFLSNEASGDKMDAALLIADLIIGACEGVPAIYIAALITKIGLKEWCKSGNNLR